MDIIWVGFAFVFGILVSRMHVPPLVGYLAAGLGLSFFGYDGAEMLHEIAHLGVIFLLFTVGLHIRLKNILQLEVFGVGIIHMYLPRLFLFRCAFILALICRRQSLSVSHLVFQVLY